MIICTNVALRKESVDRNIILPKQLNRTPPSLSARRAWIEIDESPNYVVTKKVALRKESVDRNFCIPYLSCNLFLSLSARRAWIEIDIDDKFGGLVSVALRKESVDRNKYVVQCRKTLGGRSPQGERG